MQFTDLLHWLESTALATAIKESPWIFPTIEAFHVIAAALVVGTIAIVDLRLLGLASTGRVFTELSRDVLPWTWAAFVLAACTGALMFISRPVDYLANTPFRIKLLLLACAGANMLAFHLVTARRTGSTRERVAGTLSLTFWIAVVFFGRQIGFTMSPS